MTRVGAAFGAVRHRRWSEIRDVAEAQLALLRAQTLRWLRPVGAFVEVAATDELTGVRTSSAERKTSERLASAIIRATRYGLFRPLCLTRAVALSRMLDAHGVGGHRIRIGVRREGGAFTAHAWVELENRVLGDSVANTLGYLPLTQVSVAGVPMLSGIARHRLHRGPMHAGDRLEWDQ